MMRDAISAVHIACLAKTFRFAATVLSVLALLAFPAVSTANISMTANGEADELVVPAGTEVTFVIEAENCGGINADRWRDTWIFGDGATEEAVFNNSPCQDSPFANAHTYDTPGTYVAEFVSAYCENYVTWPPGQAGCQSGWIEFDRDSVTVIVEPPQPEVMYAYYFDELEWLGNAGEVEDFSGNDRHGNAVGATTAGEEPARPGATGTCRYGVFESGQRVTGPSSSDVNAADSFTLAAWVRMRRDEQENNFPALFAYGDTRGDAYAGRFELFIRRGSPDEMVFAIRRSNDQVRLFEVSFNDLPVDPLGGEWVHVALSYANQNRLAALYINGELVDSEQMDGPPGVASTTGGLGLMAHAGGAYDAIGNMDEPRLFSGALTSDQITAVYQQTRDCGGEIDHYRIMPAMTSGVTCASNVISIEARDVDNNPINPTAGTILGLSSDTGGGYWSSLLAGGGAFFSGPDGSASYEFTGDESGITLAYDYTDIAVDPQTVTPAATDSNGVGSIADSIAIARAGFRLVDIDTGLAGIPSQIAGKPSDVGYNAAALGIQAIRESNEDPQTCDGIYDEGQAATVSFGAECRDPGVCGPELVQLNGNAIATSDDNGDPGTIADYTDVNLTFQSESIAPITLNYLDVGALRLYARAEIPRADGTMSGDYLFGSSGDYTVRPFGFFVDSPILSDSVPAPDGPVTAIAGDLFEVTVWAVSWQAEDDQDGDGRPDEGADLSDNPITPSFGAESQVIEVSLSPTVAAPASGSDGFLGSSIFNDFVNGSDQITTFWSESGYVHLNAVLSQAYLGSETVHGQGRNAGRFRPDHFHVNANQPQLEAACDSAFTYLRQPIDFEIAPEITIVPRNLNDEQTTNYDDFSAQGEGNWWRLDDISPQYEEIGSDSPVEVFIDDGMASHSPPANEPDNAQVTLVFSGPLAHELSGSAIDIAPYDSTAQLSFAILDPDGVAYENPDDGSSTFRLEIGYDGSEQIRHGRLNIGNAHGSDRLDLAGIVHAEYFGGDEIGWRRHDDDVCTTGLTMSVTPRDGTASTCIIEPGNQSGAGCGSGETNKNWQEPPQQPQGGDFNAWFRLTNELASHDVTATSLPEWLEYDWSGDGNHDEAPSGVITFGIYEGQDRQIDLRESW
ncbi:LamG domain-containing protein [Natronospira bacteriovora]|uniref:LamG domain-containing protein n=1 Tax=Natronospira bacteriovora TaxID=3069753 RepID=A0ABU0W7A5_9GAMM|nr:LamG domain-containing protein [Natronospira sp. AB-CW4]MDQ2069889.1 LamG domain-containing protein [Natronospira sp. AB-CW4]